MAFQTECSKNNCSNRSVAKLEAQAFCLEHFCLRCYEVLVELEQSRQADCTLDEKHRTQIADECAKRVVDVCLCAERLNNLERARLLDILLWCGDLMLEKNRQVPAG
jgi:hypothetical protein